MDKKTAKYDRQLRLWGGHGQQALESSHICLLNASSLGSETLKNLVLPAIGKFTVVDDTITSLRDVGTNFFLDEGSVGKPRAQVVTELLNELNDEVQGFSIVQNVKSLIEKDIEFFKQFNLIIATEADEPSLKKLAAFCASQKPSIPLVHVATNGFFGLMRLQTIHHTVLETHPDKIIDFRFDDVFPELQAFVDSFELEKLNATETSHVPYPIFILKAIQFFKKEKNVSELNDNNRDLSALKDILKRYQHKDSVDDENIAEALSHAYRVWQKTSVASNVKDVWEVLESGSVSEVESPFWTLAAALKLFVDKEGKGKLPLAGVVPDMKADTSSYVTLQTIYRNKAKQDKAIIRKYVNHILEKHAKETSFVTDEELDRFCKNAAFIQVLSSGLIQDEYSTTWKPSQVIASGLSDGSDHTQLYLLFRASELFFVKHGRYPGTNQSDLEHDKAELEQFAQDLLQGWGIAKDLLSNDYLQEFVRAGRSVLHPIIAIMGGIASQEIIKLVTHQYLPLKTMLIFNGIPSTSSSFEI